MSAGLILDFGIIIAFEFSSNSMYVTSVEFSFKVTEWVLNKTQTASIRGFTVISLISLEEYHEPSWG